MNTVHNCTGCMPCVELLQCRVHVDETLPFGGIAARQETFDWYFQQHKDRLIEPQEPSRLPAASGHNCDDCVDGAQMRGCGIHIEKEVPFRVFAMNARTFGHLINELITKDTTHA